MKFFLLGFITFASLVASVTDARAAVFASSDFSTFSDGALVGQNGWQQFATPTTAPLTVNAGSVSWAGGSVVDNQDAVLPFASQILQSSAPFVVTFDMTLRVSSAPAGTPSYFAGLSTLTNNTVTGNFVSARLAAQSLGAGFVFGGRVNGQGGYPYAFGTTELNFNQTYALRAVIDMVPGNANDTLTLFVGNDFNSLSLHSTAGFASGTVTDPTFGGVVLSQFGNATTGEPGVSISSFSVSAIPEPSSMAVLCIAGIGGAIARRRFKNKQI